MNYTSSQRHDGTVSCIKKIVYRQNTGGAATRTGILLSWSCECAAGSRVRRVWVKRSTCFSLQNEQKMQEHLLPAWYIISRYSLRHSGIRKEDNRDSRGEYIFGQNKSIEREKNTPLRPMDLILISAVFPKGAAKYWLPRYLPRSEYYSIANLSHIIAFPVDRA